MRWDEPGDDVPGSGDLDLIDVACFHGCDQPRQVRLGVVHVHLHDATLAKLARPYKSWDDDRGSSEEEGAVRMQSPEVHKIDSHEPGIDGQAE